MKNDNHGIIVQHISKRHQFVQLTELDFSVVSQQNILTFDVSMNDTVAMEMCEAAKNLATDIRDPLHAQRVAADRFYQLRYRPSTTELHHEPQLIIFAIDALADERAVVCSNVPMMRILHNNNTSHME